MTSPFATIQILGCQHFQVITDKLQENAYIVDAYTHGHEQQIKQVLKTNPDTQAET